MHNNVILFVALFLTWFVFSGYSGAFFLISGGVSCLVVVWLSRRMEVIDAVGVPMYLKPRLLLYLLWLVKEIVLSCIQVSFRVWQVEPKVSPTLSWVRSMQKNDAGRALFANSITLTPGTVSVMVEENDVQVHALVKDSLEDLRAGRMDERIARVTN